MALQLRRGTDAQRSTITPVEGEPLWTTDTHVLYVGDGVTPGGVEVSGGGASTGNIRFSGTWIKNVDTGDIYISPQDGNTGVYFPSDSNAGTSAVEIFNLDAEGKVRIDAHNKSWVFGPDGSITFPDSTVQNSAGLGSTSTFTEIFVGPNDGEGELKIYRDGTNGHIISNTDPGNDYLTIASQRWLFLNPAEAVIVNENDPANSLLRVNKITPAGTYTEVIVDGNTSVTGNLTVGTLKVDQYADITTNGANSIDLYTNNFEADGVEVWLKHNDQVQINTANGVYSWQFKNDGNLSVPGNIDGSEGAVASMTGFRAGWYGGTAGYSFKNDTGQDTGMFSWGDGDLRLRANSDDVLQMTTAQAQFNKDVLLNGVSLKLNGTAAISNPQYNDILMYVGDSAVRINGDQGLIIGDGAGSSQLDVNQITGLGGGELNVASVLKVGTGASSAYITSRDDQSIILQTDNQTYEVANLNTFTNYLRSDSFELRDNDYNLQAQISNNGSTFYGNYHNIGNMDANPQLNSQGSSTFTICAGSDGSVSGKLRVTNQGTANVKLISPDETKTLTLDNTGVTINNTATIATSTLGKNNGERNVNFQGAPLVNYSNSMLLKVGTSGHLFFGLTHPSLGAKTAAISRSGHFILQNGYLANASPAGISLQASDSGVVRMTTDYDDGSVYYTNPNILVANDQGVVLNTYRYTYDTDTDEYHEMVLDFDGAIKLPQVNKVNVQYNFDSSDNTVTLETDGTFSFNNMSGEVLINDLYDGYVYKFLVGGGLVQLLGTTNPDWTPSWSAATSSFTIADYITMSYDGAYTFENIASERDFSFYAVRTRIGT